MTLPRLLAILSLVLFGAIGIAALFKHGSDSNNLALAPAPAAPLEIELDREIQVVAPAVVALAPEPLLVEKAPLKEAPKAAHLPTADRIEELFNKEGPKLPIVETITYKSRVSWLKGRPAWLSDYASHYHTSRHFIARSLNGKADYLKQELAEGDRFNVLRNDKNFKFHLVVDTSCCKMWFYYVDLDEKKNVLLKTYSVGLGRIDSSRASGLLTPLGTYTLGDRIVVYKPKMIGPYQGKQIEMITVFGTRWIPFEKEVGMCTAPAKGLGIHGTPWIITANGDRQDNPSSIGKYESDGCIRLATPDVEELFAIIVTKPTTIEIVRSFSESSVADAH
jgi:hypothetical protein